MIARKLLPALVLALPLVTEAQAPRADYAGVAAPLVRLWIPGTLHFRFGQPIPVSFELSEAAHVAVFRIDGSGRLMVLWPQRNSLQTAARGGREYRITGPRSSYAAFQADFNFGQGMVVAIASPDPIDLSALRRYRNDDSFFYHASAQRPYIGGAGHVVDRLAQEVLYAPDSPFDYDVAFYSVSGSSHYGTAYCEVDYPGYGRSRYRTSVSRYSLGGWDDCYSSRYFGYYAYCAAWSAFYGVYGYPFCRASNPYWPGPRGPIAGGPQPQQPTPNLGMIDTIMARPVATSGQPTGTTHIVHMEPARDAPNVTRWLPDDDNGAISLPTRFRRDRGEPSRDPGISTRDEGYPRHPNTGIRVGDEPDRSPGSAFMPPVREPPRPVAWRDDDRNRTRDNGSSYSAPQRWERPRSTDTPRSPQVDRGQPSAGSGSASPAPAAMPPKTDATVTKSDGKASDSKGSSERRPPH